jgi:hypothetical protein
MKKIPIGTHIYEFQCDPILINQVYTEVSTSDKIIWSSAMSSDKMESSDSEIIQAFPQMGYFDKARTVSYYHPALYDWFDDCISKVVEDSIPSTKLTITEAWLNKLKFGQESKRVHHHSMSVYSGLLYLTTHAGTSFTNFYPGDEATKIMDNCLNFGSGQKNGRIIDPKTDKNIFLSAPLAGKLLIFPSNLKHNISIHKDIKNIRYTLAFNTFFDGLISGEVTGRLDIKVKSVKEVYENFIMQK